MADKRITDVDFLDSLNSDESFFVNQNNTIKQISRNDIVFPITSGGTGATNAAAARANLGAASSEEVDELVKDINTINGVHNDHISDYNEHIIAYEEHMKDYEATIEDLYEQIAELNTQIENLESIIKGHIAEDH